MLDENCTKALSSMGLDPNDGTILAGVLDDVQAQDIRALLDSKISNLMIISGDWRKARFDVYDLALKFVEDNFIRARCEKSENGRYVIIAVGILR